MLPEFLALIVQHLFSLLSLIVPHNFVDNLIKSTIGLFVVIDPVGSVPLFIALTRMMEKHERKAVSKIAIITAAALLIVFAVAGTQILAIFGITIFSFMVAGGVLLLMVNPIYRLLGRRGSMIVTRVFAVFIAAIAVQYIVQGAKHLFI